MTTASTAARNLNARILMLAVQPNDELSDAGGPARSHRQLTRPARIRSSDFVVRPSFLHVNIVHGHWHPCFGESGQLIHRELHIPLGAAPQNPVNNVRCVLCSVVREVFG